MASVKASFLAGITALAVIAYFGWVFVSHGLSDYTAYRGSVYASKSDGFGQSNQPEILIFGGSAGVYGVSAGHIEQATGREAYNLTLPGEGGFSFDAYQAWILDETTRQQREAVGLVVWYPIQFLGGNKTYFEDSSVDVLGRQRVPWYLPRYSLLEYLTLDKSQFNPGIVEPGHGDLAFQGSNLCTDAVPASFGWARNSELTVAVTGFVDFSRSEFPNANILIAFPAAWYDPTPSLESRASALEDLESAVELVVTDRELSDTVVDVLLLEPLTSAAEVCNLAHHANDSGRSEISQQIAAAIVAVSTPGSDNASHD